MKLMLPRKLMAEFIGTFFLVLAIGLTGNPAAIGVSLMVMLYAFAPISGAHFNPAVTLGVMLRGKLKVSEAPHYMIAQVAGAAAAAGITYWQKGVPPIPASFQVPEALLMEFIFTFALVFVVLMVATLKRTAGNGYYGLAIAGTVLAGALCVGNISGGAFNPAVAVALPLMGIVDWPFIWVYLVANFAGGGFAALIFQMLNPEE